ncbi:unnamed protein product [Caenorhabditis brenneri]
MDCLPIFLVAVICSVTIYTIFLDYEISNPEVTVSKFPVQNLSSYDQCVLPKFDIWDEEIIGYLSLDQDPLKSCNTTFKPFTELKNRKWKVVTKEDVKCRARCHTRKDEFKNIIGNWSYDQGSVTCEILETVCADKNETDVYGWLHSQVVPTRPNKPKVDTSNLKQYDVIVILFDSMSYSQAKRSIPRTLSYFNNHMEGVMFPYLNKVGDNSRPNGMALWYGKTLENIDRSIFEEPNIPADWDEKYFCKVFKDNETSIFGEFQEYGYKTMLAEDWGKGALNYPNCVGFDTPPVDHYMRPFQNAYENRGQAEEITRNHLEGQFCRETHHTLLDYMSQFVNAYPNQKKFGWIWAIRLGHFTENGFGHADKDYQKFLMDHRKQLEESFVFLLADHGFRLGSIRNTVVGALDVNNPLTAISIPKSLRTSTKMLDILKENAKKIQSHYDTRATMLDIMKYQSKANFTDTDPQQIPGEKGTSYIRRQPATVRTCRNLPIPLQYCLCQFNKTEVPTDSKTATDIGKVVTDVVNEQLKEGNFTDKCITMEYEKTIELEQYDEQFKGSTLYTIKLKMKKPSEAEFKANVKIYKGKVHVLGLVERSNRYGHTADCIDSEYHRPYCYCKIQKEEKKD